MNSDARELLIRELKDTNSQLNTKVQKLTEESKERENLLAAQTQEIANLKEQVTYLTNKIYGKTSERRKVKENPDQMTLEGMYPFIFNEVEKEADPKVQEPETEEVVVKEHTRKKKSTINEKNEGLPAKKIVEELPEEERICRQCGEKLERIGERFVRMEFIIIPAKIKMVEYNVAEYKCQNCGGENDTSYDAHSYITSAETKKALIPHSMASESIVSWVIIQKHVNGMPLYRLEEGLKQEGAEISLATMANWVIAVAKNYLSIMYDFFHRELVKRKYLMADETRVQVLKEPGRKAETQSFMWLYRSGEDGLNPIILYNYQETRGGKNASNFLKGFKGYLETDGFTGYNRVEGITRCCCWAHARRKFVDAIPKGKEKDYSLPAVQGVGFIDRLFKLEEEIRKQPDFTYEKRYEFRLQKEKPILEAFWRWVNEKRPVRKSKFDTAVMYAKNHKEQLMNYLKDGHCSISNNASENSIRPFTVGRKNWLFSDTPAGVEASAVCYSIVEMAKAYSLNPYQYLVNLLEHRPSKEMNDEELSKLAPWDQDIRKEFSK